MPDHPYHEGARKRVCKACDRCRQKKSKCDGINPCLRCQEDDVVCVFGQRKKSHDKAHPKGYAEMLGQQQAWLISALRELYRLNVKGEGWPGDVLETESNGFPLTHNLLSRLGILGREEYEYPRINPEPRRKSKPVDDSPAQYSPVAPSVPSPVESHQQLIPATPTMSAEKPSNTKNPSLELAYENLQYEAPEPCLPSPWSYHDTEQWLSQNPAFFEETNTMLGKTPKLMLNDPLLYEVVDSYI